MSGNIGSSPLHQQNFLDSDQSPSTGQVLSIEFPQQNQLRSRKVVTRSRSRATGKYASWKVGRMVQWESIHERNAFRLLDCDPVVRRFTEQPCKIEFHIHGVPHVHYPDILVEIADRKELWEVKTAEDASSPEVIKRTAVLARELPGWGYTYRVILAHELAEQPRLNNALTLLKFGRGPITTIDREFVLEILRHTNELTWGEVCDGRLGPRGRRIVSRLVLEGKLTVDMHSPIDPETLVTARKGVL